MPKRSGSYSARYSAYDSTAMESMTAEGGSIPSSIIASADATCSEESDVIDQGAPGSKSEG
jgi:hypothetical protein